MMRLSRQNGAALLIALLVLFMVSAIAITISSDFQVLLRRSEYQQTAERLQLRFRGLESLARRALNNDHRKSPRIDFRGEQWAQPFEFSWPSGKARGQLIDLQGRFNINALSDNGEFEDGELPGQQPGQLPGTKTLTISQLRFIRLLQTLNIKDMNVSKATALTEALSDWLDDNDSVSGFGGAEDDFYADEEPPYRPANKTMADISELRLVKGMNPEIYRALLPHITIWPQNSLGEINIHTATSNVLATINVDLIPEPLADNEREWLEDQRKNGRFPSLTVFKQGPFLARNLNTENLIETSDYFLLLGEITENERKYVYQAILHRTENHIRIVSRRISGYDLPETIKAPEFKTTDEDADSPGLDAIDNGPGLSNEEK